MSLSRAKKKLKIGSHSLQAANGHAVLALVSHLLLNTFEKNCFKNLKANGRFVDFVQRESIYYNAISAIST